MNWSIVLFRSITGRLKRVLLLVMVLIMPGLAVYSQTYWWTGGTGDWSELAHWSSTDPTTLVTPVASLPDENIDVVFVDASFTSTYRDTVHLKVETGICKSFTWDLGPQTASKKPLWNQQKPLQVYGNFTLHVNLSLYDLSDINFKATSGTWTITTAGHSLNKVFFEGYLGVGVPGKLSGRLPPCQTFTTMPEPLILTATM